MESFLPARMHNQKWLLEPLVYDPPQVLVRADDHDGFSLLYYDWLGAKKYDAYASVRNGRGLYGRQDLCSWRARRYAAVRGL